MTDIADTSTKMRHELVGILPRLNSFACRLTGSRDDGADLVQSACQRALESVHQWRPDARLDSWMYRIIHNLWIDGLRKQSGRRTWPLDGLQDAGPAIDGRTAVDARLMLGQVRQVIEDLPQEQRDVLELIVVDGSSYKDAADRLGVPVGTVMSRLARARGKLKAQIGWPVASVLIAVALGLKTEDEALADDGSLRDRGSISFAPIAELERTARDSQTGDHGYAKTIVALAYVLGWLQEQRGIVESSDQSRSLDDLAASLLGETTELAEQAEGTALSSAPRHADEATFVAQALDRQVSAAEPEGLLPSLEGLELTGPEGADVPSPAAAAAGTAQDGSRDTTSGAPQDPVIVSESGDGLLGQAIEATFAGEDADRALPRATEVAGGVSGAVATFQLQSTNSQIGLTATAGTALMTAGTELLDSGLVLIGGAADDVLLGGAGDDVLMGGAGDDILEGGAGSDQLFGGDDDDVLYGGDPDGSGSGGPSSAPDIPDEAQVLFRDLPTLPGDSGEGVATPAPASTVGSDDSPVEDVPQAAETTGEPAAQEAEPLPEPDQALDQDAEEPVSEAQAGDPTMPLPREEPVTDVAARELADAPSDDAAEPIVGGGGDVLVGGEFVEDPILAEPEDLRPSLREPAEDQLQERIEDEAPAETPAPEPPEPEASEPEPEVAAGPEESRASGEGRVIRDQNDDHVAYWWGYDDFLFGGRGNDLAFGGRGDDWLFGGEGKDRLFGGDDDDLLFGGDQDDVIWGGTGDDIVVGGDGVDRAVFDGDRSDFLITGTDASQLSVTDLRAGSPAGWDFLIEIETLEFNDGHYDAGELVQEYQAWVSARLLAAEAEDAGDPIPIEDVVDSGSDDVAVSEAASDDSPEAPEILGGQIGPAVSPVGESDPLPPVEQVVEETGAVVQSM